jgi:hypothetical protein
VIHGVKSFESLRSRAEERKVGSLSLLIASLDDIIASKKSAGRDRDLAVLPVLEKTRREASPKPVIGAKPRKRGKE